MISRDESEPFHKDKKASDVILAEFNSLRTEILNRSNAQQQMLYLALIAGGALTPIGVQTQEIAVLLIAPIIAFFLSVRYADHGAHISRIGTYIEEKIEPRLPGLGWERWLHKEASPSLGQTGILEMISSRGLFITIEILPVVFILLKFWQKLDLLVWILLSIDILIPIISWFLLQHRRWRKAIARADS
jgi:hypothetical protein